MEENIVANNLNIVLNRQKPKSAFQVTLYRLSIQDEAFNKLQLSLPYALNYDFADEIDSRADFFWRNLYKLSQDKYLKFYENNIKKIQESIKSQDFYLKTYDLTPHFIDYTLGMDLNTVAEAISIELKNPGVEIKENDMIIVEEVGVADETTEEQAKTKKSQIILLGFVTNITKSLKFGDFFTQNINLFNIGKMYSIAKIATDPSVAEYSIKGLDLKFLDIPVKSDIFNGKDVFQIMESIYVNFFFGKILDKKSEIIEYVMDEKKVKNFDTFNVLFPFVYTLYLYQKDYNADFRLCAISNGKHQAFIEYVRNALRVWLPTYKTVNEVITSALNSAMYDYFFDYDGKLIVRPPLYNYFPLNNYNISERQEPVKPNISPSNPRFESAMRQYQIEKREYDNNKTIPTFKWGEDFVISRDMITDFIYDKNNTDIEVRTDAYFTWAYQGTFENIAPQFYEDIPALVKFGFRNETPYNNPNAQSEKTARLLAMIYNMKTNHSSRSLTISVKMDKPLIQSKFELGRLYYIDLPELRAMEDNGEELQQIIDSGTKITSKGIMGYLVKIKKAYNYGSYVVYNLVFTYCRNIEILDLKKYENASGSLTGEYGAIIEDLYNIYGDNPIANPNPYGFMAKLQQKRTTITSNEFEREKRNALNKFVTVLKESGYYNNIPIFKTMPSIMDLIELTYSDTETKNAIANSANKKVADTTTTSDLAATEDNLLVYKSYRFKSGIFFKYDINAGRFDFAPRDNYPYKGSVREILFSPEEENKFLTEFELKMVNSGMLNNAGSIDNYQTNYQNSIVLLTVSGSANASISRDNGKIAQFRTRMPIIAATNDDYYKISQKLLNRIIEMDADLMDRTKCPWVSNMFWKYSTSSNKNNTDSESGTNWETSQLGQSYQIYPFLYDQITQFTHNAVINKGTVPSTLFNISNIKKDLPIGKLIARQNGYVGITDEVAQADWGTNNTVIDLVRDNTYYFSPAFFFNMQNLLNFNTVTTTISEQDAAQFVEKGVSDGSEFIKAHKEGRAIDFILPAQEDFFINAQGKIVGNVPGQYTEIVRPMPFVMFGLNGNYTLKPQIFNFFEQLLPLYFDKIVKTKVILQIDKNELKGLTGDNLTPDIVKMGVYNYHIEVRDKNYLNIGSEVFATKHGVTGNA